MLYAGIDPGQTGAISLVDEAGEIVEIKDFSSIEDMCCWLSYISLCQEGNKIKLCVLEKVSAMPGQGVSSTFKFGTNFGAWMAMLSSFKIPYQLKTPQAWMKGAIVPSDHQDKKKRGLTVCRRLYPEASWFRREKDHNRADATLMALHARKLCEGG